MMIEGSKIHGKKSFNAKIVEELKNLAIQAANGKIEALMIIPIGENDTIPKVFSPEGGEESAKLRALLNVLAAQTLGKMLEDELNKEDNYILQNEELLRELASTTMATGLVVTQKAFALNSEGEDDE